MSHDTRSCILTQSEPTEIPTFENFDLTDQGNLHRVVLLLSCIRRQENKVCRKVEMQKAINLLASCLLAGLGTVQTLPQTSVVSL